MSTTISYKGSTLTTVENQTKVLETAGTWLEDDLTVTDESSGGSEVLIVDTPDVHGGTVREITTTSAVYLQGSKSVTPTGQQQTVLPDQGYDGFASVVISGGESLWMMAPDPTDGHIHVWINLTDDMGKEVKVHAGNSTSDSVDFGDGSEPVYITSSGGTYGASHTYDKAGVYDITIYASVLPANNNLVTSTSNSVMGRRLMRRVYIPSSFESLIGQYKFQYGYAIEKVTICNTSEIGMYAFYKCFTLREIVLPEGVVTIGSNAFYECSTVKRVVIPSTCTSIDSNAFNYVYADEFHIKPTTPPTLANSNAFGNGFANRVLYVPYSADHSILEAYQTATNWSTYASQMQEEPQS